MVFPNGVGVLPWMLCGTNSIGEATAEKMKVYRLVIWGMHGIYGAGRNLDETFDLIETVEKALQIYKLTAHLPPHQHHPRRRDAGDSGAFRRELPEGFSG